MERTEGSAILPGEYYRSTRFVGPTIGNDSLTWRVDESAALFAPRPGRAGGAWQVDYSSAANQPGLRFGFGAAEADRSVAGASALGLGPGQLGTRRVGYHAGWQGNRWQAIFESGRTQDQLLSSGVDRRSLNVEALGAWYRQTVTKLDAGLELDTSTQSRLLSAEGYGLGSRQAGAGGGYTSLNSLGGLSDTTHDVGYATGRLRAAYLNRVVERDGQRVTDEGAELSYGPLAFSRTERGVSSQANWLAEAGYGGLSRLRGGSEQRDALSLTTKAVRAAWSANRLRRDGSQQATEERSLGWSPSANTQLDYSHRDDLGTAASDTVSARLKADQHSLAISASSQRTGAAESSDGELSRSLQSSYALGQLLNLRYQASDWAKRGAAGAESWRAQHEASLETGAGFAARGRVSTAAGQTDGLYGGLSWQRQLTTAWKVDAGYDTWSNAADPSVTIAGVQGVLKVAAPEAEQFRFSSTLATRAAELGAQHRTLTWQSGAGAEGSRHALSESSVTARQNLSASWRLSGAWRSTADEEHLRSEQRETSLAFAPGGKPGFELGWRQSRAAATAFSPTAFASAQLTPWLGLTLSGKVEHQAGAGGEWADADRRGYTVGLQQNYLGDGLLKAQYSRTTGNDLSRASEAPSAGLGYQIEVATPSNFVLPGLRLSGKWQDRRDPGTSLDHWLERSATLSLENRVLGLLRATYTDQGRTGYGLRGPLGRLSFEYATPQGSLGKLSVTGYVDDVTNRWDIDHDREKYRVGFQYQLPL